MKKILVIAFILFLLAPRSFSEVGPAKPRVRPAGKAGAVAGFISPSLRRDRLALIVYFYNLTKYKSVSYMLTYNANGVPQGVQGSVPVKSYSASRTLLFGTCSKNVCTYHKNIKDMIFEATAVTKTGKTEVKKYRIKI